MKTLNVLLTLSLVSILLSGCSVKQVNEPTPDASAAPDITRLEAQDKQESTDFVLVNPLRDDPDNPSPHNPFIKKFGDIPEVRTYMRLRQKLVYGPGLTVDEAIALYTAEAHLYPDSSDAKESLKQWKADKQRYIRLGIPAEGPVMMHTRPEKDDRTDVDAARKAADFILTDNPDNPSPDNPLIKEFGDIPEVRTYMRLKQKLKGGAGLTIDEAIALYTAEAHLYPSPEAEEMLADLQTDKQRYERLGLPADEPVFFDTLTEERD